jgi:hypothetical protein
VRSPRAILRADGTTKGRIKQIDERLLFERLAGHKADILRFATDACAAFDTNLAERDLRMMKVQQKISGSFRSMDGAKVCCVVCAVSARPSVKMPPISWTLWLMPSKATMLRSQSNRPEQLRFSL